LTLGLFPEWFAAIQPDWPASMRLAGFPLYDERDAAPISAEVEAFLAAGAPPVAFTPGSAMLEGREFFAASVDACLRADLRGLLLSRHGEQIPANLPPSVRHFSFVPFSQLLPRCAAVVHHAGVGSSAQGLAAGIPQLVFDLGAFDQPDNIRRLKQLGVAASLPRARYKGPAAAKALGALLADQVLLARCQAVAAKFAGTDPIGAACAEIEAAAARAGIKVAA
jgi:UDP:flavonoid glycosyltransferase YjiC (YdhE family)